MMPVIGARTSFHIVVLCLLSTLAAVLTAGCGTPQASATPVPIPPTFIRHTDTAAGVSVSYPPDWVTDIESFQASVESRNEILRGEGYYVHPGISELLFGAGRRTEGGYSPSLTIFVDAFPGLVTPQQYIGLARDDIVEGVKWISDSEVQNGKTEAVMAVYEYPDNGGPARNYMLVATRGRVALVFNCTVYAPFTETEQQECLTVVRSAEIFSP